MKAVDEEDKNADAPKVRIGKVMSIPAKDIRVNVIRDQVQRLLKIILRVRKDKMLLFKAAAITTLRNLQNTILTAGGLTA